MLIYDGLHYDAMAISAFEGAPGVGRQGSGQGWWRLIGMSASRCRCCSVIPDMYEEGRGGDAQDMYGVGGGVTPRICAEGVGG